MEHKFIIEVGLKYVGPEENKENPKPKPKVTAMPLDAKVLQSLLSQLPHALAAMQPNPKKKD